MKSLTRSTTHLGSTRCTSTYSATGTRGFYKLSEESIATVREDLTQDYQALADHHTEEIVQLLEDFGESQDDASLELHDIEAEQKRAEEAKK